MKADYSPLAFAALFGQAEDTNQEQQTQAVIESTDTALSVAFKAANAARWRIYDALMFQYTTTGAVPLSGLDVTLFTARGPNWAGSDQYTWKYVKSDENVFFPLIHGGGEQSAAGVLVSNERGIRPVIVAGSDRLVVRLHRTAGGFTGANKNTKCSVRGWYFEGTKDEIMCIYAGLR